RVEQDENLVDHLMAGASEILKYSVKGRSEFEFRGLTEGQKPEIAAERPTSAGTTGLYSWSPSAPGSALFENQTYDLDSVVFDQRNSTVIGARYVDDMPKTIYFDPAMQRVQDSLEKAYPGQSVSILSRDDAGTAYVLLTQGPKNPSVLSLYTT